MKIVKHYRKYGEVPNVGDKFGRWTVVDNNIIMLGNGNNKCEVEKGKNVRRTRSITCQCECGTIKIVRLDPLYTGKSKGCLCISGDFNRKRSINESVGTLSRTQFTYFKNCASRRDISWELTMDFLWDLYVKQNKKCALSGMSLDMTVKVPRRGNTNTASLDRIDSNKSYTEDNVQWVHKDINKLKSNFSDEYFIELCKLVGNFHN